MHLKHAKSFKEMLSRAIYPPADKQRLLSCEGLYETILRSQAYCGQCQDKKMLTNVPGWNIWVD